MISSNQSQNKNQKSLIKDNRSVVYITNCKFLEVCCRDGKLCGGDENNNSGCQEACKKAFKNPSLRGTGEGCPC